MADGELPDIALLMRYGFAFGGRRNPVGVRIQHDSGCSVDVTGGGRGDMHRDDEQPHAEASPADAGWDPASLACLAPTVSQPSEWIREQCARMRRGQQSAWDEHGASLRAPGRAAASLHSTWIQRGSSSTRRCTHATPGAAAGAVVWRKANRYHFLETRVRT